MPQNRGLLCAYPFQAAGKVVSQEARRHVGCRTLRFAGHITFKIGEKTYTKKDGLDALQGGSASSEKGAEYPPAPSPADKVESLRQDVNITYQLYSEGRSSWMDAPRTLESMINSQSPTHRVWHSILAMMSRETSHPASWHFSASCG